MSNFNQPTGAPPSYEDAAISLPGRQPPLSRPMPELIHTINIKAPRISASTPLAIPFPANEETWTSTRDVQHADWERFVSDLAQARAIKAEKTGVDQGEPSGEQILCMREALRLWNYNFFEPRGCVVRAVGFEKLGQADNKQKTSMIFGKEGIRFKRIGRGMLGFTFNGYFVGLGLGRVT